MHLKLLLSLFTLLFGVNLSTTELTNKHLAIAPDNDLRVLELSGTPFQRGLAHGTMLREDIKAVIKLFKEDIRTTTKEDPDAFIAMFLEKTDYKTAIQKHTPELWEELKGISKGSGIDMNTLFMHQLGDEYWFNAQDLAAHHCSSFAMDKTASQPSRTAQNMDIPQFYHGFQTLLKIKDKESDKEMMVLSIPGHLGITGMNNKQVSINCNTLMQLDYGTSGLPVTFIVRGVLAKGTQKEALDFLQSIPHASGQNYMIGGPDKVYSMECSAKKVVEFRPFEKAPFTYHTNHPMANDDYNVNYLGQLEVAQKTPEEGLRQCQRISSFEKRFTENTNDISISDIKEILSSRDHDGKDVVSNDWTYASVIYELSNKPVLYIAPGKPHETEYQLHYFK